MQNNIVHEYMQLIPWRSKRVRSYIKLNLKFHDYSRFFTAFDLATYTVWISSRNSVIKSVVKKIGGGDKSSALSQPYFQPILHPSSLKPYIACTLKSNFIINSPHIPAFLLLNPVSNFKNCNSGQGAIALLAYTITQKYYNYQCKILLCVSVPNIKAIRLLFLRNSHF